MSAQDFAGRTFVASAPATALLTGLVIPHAPADRACAILEVGCATGELLLGLAGALPRARLTGIDLSPANIRRARRARHDRGSDGRVTLLAGDYRQARLGPFDLIVAASTLHLIGGPSRALFAKVAGELAPGGRLVFTMPDDCLYNRMLWGVRRLFRAARGPATDRLILAVGRRLHGGGVPDGVLRDRVPYMYLLPCRHLGPGLRAVLRRCGLEPVEERAWPHASPAQPRHRLCVYRKGVS
jgi:SAM-dependent methyltransferase